MTIINRHSFRLVFVLLILVLFTTIVSPVNGAIACNETYNPCEELLYKGSHCRDGFCSNPFEKGCLNAILSGEFKEGELLPSLARRMQRQIRVCNSDDPPEARNVVCVDHQSLATAATGYHADSGSDIYADYTEVRIMSQNWESAFFGAWILQILLSEILQVPTTIETSMPDTRLNFYSPTNAFDYGESDDWGAIETANAAPFGDCRLKEKSGNINGTGEGEYTSCGHVIPEFWSGSRLGDLWRNHRDGHVDAPEGLGAIALQGLFVPKFTAMKDPTLLNLMGLSGENNRRKLAEMFLRPTSWKDYCQIVSATNCTVPDDVAQRPPTDESEDTRYHFAGVYTGYFRATEENDCDKHPTTCTGHVADYPCGWGSYLSAQVYHHKIPLKSSGPEAGSNGYSYGQLVDMYQAANKTGSNLMTMWWQPEAMYSSFLGTDAEMQRIVLPSPTQECVDHRMRLDARCEFENDQDRYGDPRGACDEAPQVLQKVVASSLYKMTYGNKAIPTAKQSPGYEAIKSFKISELQLGTILQKWIHRGVDKYGFDARLATCQWARDNLEFLEDYLPRTYPRVAKELDVSTSGTFYVAVSLGGISLIMTAVVGFLTYQRRYGYVMKFSQWEFLLLLILGLLLVSVGSILLAIPPDNASCITIQWLVGLGYTLELVPLIVKVGAMNRLMTAAKRMKRIVLTRRSLFGTVALFVFVIIIFLAFWTVIDPPRRKGEYTLTENMTEDEEYIVTVGFYCSSNSDVWQYVAVVWHCMLLIFATVLAFQTRNLQKGFSESSVLAIIIYSHFVFVMLRVLTFLLGGVLLQSQVAWFQSLIYSTDALVTISVYFIPKLLTDDDKFYALTHGPVNRGDAHASGTMIQAGSGGTGSHVTAGRTFHGSVVGSAPSTTNRASATFNISKPVGDSDDSESVDGVEATALPVNSGHSSRSSMKKSFTPKDVLKDRVSWGGMAFTTVMKNSRESENDEEAKVEELVPFQKPVDVLKGSNSWGGGHITQLIGSEDDTSSTQQDDTRHGDLTAIAEADETSNVESQTRRKSLLLASVLPKEAPPRFSYASSRISGVRQQYHPENYGDEDIA